MTHNDKLIKDCTFVVVDVETTGLSPTNDRITEIAMIKIQNNTLIDEYSTLINPLVSIPAEITQLTGIDNIMLANAPTAREVIYNITNFLDDAIFVAHNAKFDWGFVSETAKRERNLHLLNNILCTVKLSRKIMPNLNSKSLGNIAKALNIEIPQRHRASGDAFATSLVLVKYLSFLQKKLNMNFIGELLQYQHK